MTDTDKKLDERQARVYGCLKAMRLPAMAQEYLSQEQDPNGDLKPFDVRIEAIVTSEWDSRHSKKISRLLKAATLRYPDASFDSTLNDPDRKLDTETIGYLVTGNWINEGRNILITGLTGAGKTYLSNAFCVQAVQGFHSVRYLRASRLMEEMEQARAKNQYMAYIDKTSRLDLLVIDDFGLMPLDIDRCRNLFEIIDSREGRKSTIIVSQFQVSDWFDLFKNNTYADACMSRITSRAFRVEMNGRNMRGDDTAQKGK